jgi:DNA repair protein RadC
VASAPHHVGHAKRLRERLLTAGPDALADYEILELILFAAESRHDKKRIAKDLIARFGSFAGVLAADPARLGEIKGIGEVSIGLLKAVQAAAVHVARSVATEGDVIGNWRQLIAYCRAKVGFETTECFHVLYLNHRNELIADEEQERGIVDHTPVYPRKIVKRALQLEATAIIMVHNHPSGDPRPSQADVAMTREVKEVAERLGIALHDHVIVTKRGHNSFRSLGLL